MFLYNKKLQYPVKIARPNPKLASIIISQYGGPDGELGASLRYLSQRYSMPFDEQKALLTDVGTEELGHLEMIGAIVHQLTRNLKEKDIENTPLAAYFVDHTVGVYPTAASGFPWSAASMQVKAGIQCAADQPLSRFIACRIFHLEGDIGIRQRGFRRQLAHLAVHLLRFAIVQSDSSYRNILRTVVPEHSMPKSAVSFKRV